MEVFMNNFTPVTAEQWESNVFQSIGKEWMLITAKKQDHVNTMTASWGGLGVLWGKPVAFVFIRESRYTKEFVDASNTFSLNFFAGEYKKELGYLGKVSGRKEDKIKNAGFTVVTEEETPYFDEANTVFLCRKMAAVPIQKEHFIDMEIDTSWYQDQDYHTMYVAEITQILTKK